MLRLDSPVSLVCAGRTDAGVHARGQVAHVDLPERAIDRRRPNARPPVGSGAFGTTWRYVAISAAPPGFDARFSAIWRRYVYRLSDASVPPDPLRRHDVARIGQVIDVDAVNAGAPALLGLRDFAAFCRQREGASTIRTLLDLHAERRPEMIEITVRADAFCHSMVRSLVGALVAVGSGRRDLDWLAKLTDLGVRDSAVQVMPPPD